MVQASLEGLPVELRCQILLNVPGFRALRALVHATPVYHQTYLTIRGKIWGLLIQTGHDVIDIAEALAAVRSAGLTARDPANKEAILSLLDCRRRGHEPRPTLSPAVPFNAPASTAESARLLRLRDQADFFLRDYCWAVHHPPWMDGFKWNALLPIHPSLGERRRFYRAFYRMQTFCNIFGEIGSSEPFFHRTWANGDFDTEEVWAVFFGTMPFWEVEEFGCFWMYCRQKYELMSQYVLGTGCGFVDRRLWHGDLAPMASRGPSFLHRLLHSTSHETLKDFVIRHTYESQDAFLTCHPDLGAPLLYPADKYGDRDVDAVLAHMKPEDHPPAAWIDYWYGRDFTDQVWVLEMVDPAVGNKDAWKWGYVIWDADRLQSWGAWEGRMFFESEFPHVPPLVHWQVPPTSEIVRRNDLFRFSVEPDSDASEDDLTS